MRLNKIDKNLVKVVDGNLAIDDRGMVSYVNDFDFSKVKRFYMLENFGAEIVRAFHGHMKEAKYALAVNGTALVVVVKLSRIKNPSKKALMVRTVLSARKPQILYIPPGFANGFIALEPDTKVIFFSTSTIIEAQKDDYRYPADYWGKDIWKIENR